jgi:hypothetical protein
MNIRYRVDLSEAERTELMALLNGGKHAVRKIKRAQIPLAADVGHSDELAKIRRARSPPQERRCPPPSVSASTPRPDSPPSVMPRGLATGG